MYKLWSIIRDSINEIIPYELFRWYDKTRLCKYLIKRNETKQVIALLFKNLMEDKKVLACNISLKWSELRFYVDVSRYQIEDIANNTKWLRHNNITVTALTPLEFKKLYSTRMNDLARENLEVFQGHGEITFYIFEKS